jgi:hypothetical protein
MIDAPFHFADVRTKSGEGRLDYGPWTPFVLDPYGVTASDSRRRDSRIYNGGTFAGGKFWTRVTCALTGYGPGFHINMKLL